MTVQPHVFFDGSCGLALQFYQQAVGAKVEMLMRYAEAPEPAPPGMAPEGWGDKVMHSSARIGESVVMFADDCTGGTRTRTGFSLCLAVKTPEEAKRAYEALAADGKATMPLARTFFSPAFGMLQDKFGVAWMVMVGV